MTWSLNFSHGYSVGSPMKLPENLLVTLAVVVVNNNWTSIVIEEEASQVVNSIKSADDQLALSMKCISCY